MAGFVSAYASLLRLAAQQKLGRGEPMAGRSGGEREVSGSRVAPADGDAGRGEVGAEGRGGGGGGGRGEGGGVDVVVGGVEGAAQWGKGVRERAQDDEWYEPEFSNFRDNFSGTLDYIFLRGLPERQGTGRSRRAMSK